MQISAIVHPFLATNNFIGCSYEGFTGGGGDELLASDCAMQTLGGAAEETKVRQQFKKGIVKLKEGDYLGSFRQNEG